MTFRTLFPLLVPSAFLMAAAAACGNSPGTGELTPGGTTNTDGGPPSNGADSGAGSPQDGGAQGSGGKDASTGTGNGDSGATPGHDAAVTPGTDAGVDAGLPSVGGSDVTIYVEPSAGADGTMLINAINSATSSVHLVMYMISASSLGTKIENALIAAAKRPGMDVKVILNQTFPSSSTSNSGPYNTLTSGGVATKWASNAFTYTHEKCMLIDGKTAWIMTANMSEASYSTNREYLAQDVSPDDITEVEALFQADWAQTGYTANSPTSTPAISGPLVVAPSNPMNSLKALDALIASATTSINAEVEEIDQTNTNSTAIPLALAAAAKRGVAVNLVVADTGSANSGTSATAIATIKGGGGHVWQGGTVSGSSSGVYIHAKAMVVDGTTAWIGSENFTSGSLEYNREVGVIFTKASEVAKVAATIQTDLKGATAL